MVRSKAVVVKRRRSDSHLGVTGVTFSKKDGLSFARVAPGWFPNATALI